MAVRDPKGFIRLTEEVPGVPEHDRFYIWKTGTGKIWNGATRDEGEQWAASNNIKIDEFEGFGY